MGGARDHPRSRAFLPSGKPRIIPAQFDGIVCMKTLFRHKRDVIKNPLRYSNRRRAGIHAHPIPSATDIVPAMTDKNRDARGLRARRASGQPAAPEIALIAATEPRPNSSMNDSRSAVLGNRVMTSAV